MAPIKCWNPDCRADVDCDSPEHEPLQHTPQRTHRCTHCNAIVRVSTSKFHFDVTGQKIDGTNSTLYDAVLIAKSTGIRGTALLKIGKYTEHRFDVEASLLKKIQPGPTPVAYEHGTIDTRFPFLAMSPIHGTLLEDSAFGYELYASSARTSSSSASPSATCPHRHRVVARLNFRCVEGA